MHSYKDDGLIQLVVINNALNDFQDILLQS